MPLTRHRRLLLGLLATTMLAALTAGSAPAAIEPAPGGPILVVTNAGDPFSAYYTEILRAEGLDEFATVDIGQLSAATLAGHDAVILAPAGLSSPQVQALTGWVQGGGNLIAMRPDPALAPLLGLSYVGGTVSGGDVTLDTSRAPGSGIVGAAMQFHGAADRYGLAGARAVASLSSGDPGVTQRDVGAGHAAAFAYDLARSIVGTRQGDKDWAGQDHDGDALARSTDLFMSPTPGVGDWLDRSKIAIPQADEQQRLLANLLTQSSRTPLPRFWYLPRGDKAEVVMTGDDHGSGETTTVFDDLMAHDPPGCSVADWQCVRATSYAYPESGITPSQAAFYQSNGFEIALHLRMDPGGACNVPFTSLADLNSKLATQLGQFAAFGIGAPTTIRTHCIAWSDFDSQPQADAQHGIRLNTDYYWFSNNDWDQDLAGLYTGSGFPMRFTKVDGSLIDVYQAATDSADDATASPDTVVPAQMRALIDRALGPEGYYGAFTVIVHNDSAASTQATRDAVVTYAQSRGVSIISARQLLAWTDGRNGSSFGAMSFNGGVLGFTIAQNPDARGLQALVPINGSTGALQSLARDGAPIGYTTQVIKGVAYAFFPATSGAYTAVYPPPPPPLVASAAAATARPSRARVRPYSVLSRKTKAPTFPRLRLSARSFRPGSSRFFAMTLRLAHTSRLVLTFRNAKGKAVRRIRVPKHKAGTVLRLRWDGRDSKGHYVKAGRYRFTLTAVGSHYRKTAKGSVRTLTAR